MPHERPKAQTKDKIIGWISLGSSVLSIIGGLLVFGGSIMTIAFIIVLIYCFYQTVIKKEALTKGEWILYITILF